MPGILLGWEDEERASFGFEHKTPEPPSNELISFEGDEPICIIAPTGAGKGRDFILPNILTHDGPLIVVDIKGELAEVCARRRMEMGYDVAVLDPFMITSFRGARLNPFDLLDLPGSQLDSDAEMLAAQMGEGKRSEKDPFWSDQASSLVAGLIAAAYSVRWQRECSPCRLVEYLFADDVSYDLAVMLDTIGKGLPKFAYRAIAGFLQAPENNTRPSILSTAQTFVRALGSEAVQACLTQSSIKLDDVIAGRPLDVFIVIPPNKLQSHAALIRLWVGALLTAIMQRRELPEKRTMMVLDEAAQLGTFGPLLTACTLLRGFGLQLVTVWQDVAQMKSLYALNASTILNNAGAILSFGQGHYAGAKESSEVLGVPLGELLKLPRDKAVLSIRGEGTRVIRRLNYLEDAMFSGMADPNPYHKWRDGRGQ
ncbi:MAG: type IV secretory system conjugative DNA transfer family protein [Paludisphaera borealis]|uniref:type IV secretory system conjugative DNA transfer family protein n=1 Tax=Paludisphaera borealis TaxID=1387353 RepID=UPI00283FA8F5|nr:type IV secretory system conjugative DNA transfer family protein [Paludisphaera borealis]MDR3620486.1 type IV secretory system conjugative DNA transfer family protein [Paludisphaera borealis]